MEPPNDLLVENQETVTLTITDPITRRSIIVPVQHSAVIVNPQTGARVFTSNANLQLGSDGRILKPGKGLYCHDCGRGPWAHQAVAYCTDCQIVIGRHCCTKDQTAPCCKRCRRKRFWRWLFSTKPLTPPVNLPPTAGTTEERPTPHQSHEGAPRKDTKNQPPVSKEQGGNDEDE